MTKKTLTALLLMLTVVAFCLFTYADDKIDESKGKSTTKEPEKKEVDVWMEAKLQFSQKIFDALVHGDFEAINENATAMRTVGYLEWWLRNNDYVSATDYRGQLNRFNFANEEIMRLSMAKDIEGTAEAYTELSLTCVRCHTLIRDVEKK